MYNLIKITGIHIFICSFGSLKLMDEGLNLRGSPVGPVLRLVLAFDPHWSPFCPLVLNGHWFESPYGHPDSSVNYRHL